MYSLANHPAVDKKGEMFIKKVVAHKLADWFVTVFGETNENGEFTDIDRFNEYLKNNDFLNDFYKKDIVIGKGALAEIVPAADIFLKRYSDMYAKIKDTKHEYIFDEFGEGLLFAIIYFKKNCDYEYLADYENNVDKFDMYGLYDSDGIIGLERDKILELEKMLHSAGEDYYEEVILEDCEDEKYDDYDKESIISAYALAWEGLICNVANYDGDVDGLTCDIVENECGHLGIDAYNLTQNEFLFWDEDYELIFASLRNGANELDHFLKTVGHAARYSLKFLSSTFDGREDNCTPI